MDTSRPLKSLQETFAPNSICFGCGPANAKGLRIRSFALGDEVVCDFTPSPHHEAFSGVLNGGIIGSLLDCHCNWTAAWSLMNKWQLKELPSTVTAEYTVKLLAPTPSNKPVHLQAHVEEYIKENRAWIVGELSSEGKVTATCRGLFIISKTQRWN